MANDHGTSNRAERFGSDSSYLDAEAAWLRVRTARLTAERKLVEAQRTEEEGDPDFLYRPGRIGTREAKCRAMELKQREDQLRAEIDVRLDATQIKLGLDQICEQAGLVDVERIVLLTLTAAGISQSVAEDVLGPFSKYFGSVAVSDAVAILDPACIDDWLRFRRLFRRDGRLLKHGLIRLGLASGSAGPETLMSADATLTLESFSIITGDPGALLEQTAAEEK